MRARVWSILIASSLALVVGWWGFCHEPRTLVLKEHEIALPAWPEELDGLKIAFLADLHFGSPGNDVPRMERLVDRVNGWRPDLVLLGGDYVIHGVVGGRSVPPRVIAAVLGRLTAPLGVYAVLGNHDLRLDGPGIKARLEEAGIPVLDDRGLRLLHHGGSFWLVGISDLLEGPHDTKRALALVDDDAPLLALTHNPDLFPELPARIALVLAAHTHGGQVRLPGVGPLIVPSRHWQRFAAGHVVEDGRHLFVTTGVGTSILPVRFLVPPEVSLVVLRAGVGL